MTLGEALTDSGIDREQMAELALVNNMQLDDRLEAGALIKTLKGGRGRKP